MADEENSTQPSVKPNILPAMTWQQVKERAQRIVDLRGFPPYTPETFRDSGMRGIGQPDLLIDEAAVLSEFVYFWQPYLILKAKT